MWLPKKIGLSIWAINSKLHRRGLDDGLTSPYSAYGAYFKFFSENVEELGILKTIEQYIFADSANRDDAHMLIRLFGGA